MFHRQMISGMIVVLWLCSPCCYWYAVGYDTSTFGEFSFHFSVSFWILLLSLLNAHIHTYTHISVRCPVSFYRTVLAGINFLSSHSHPHVVPNLNDILHFSMKRKRDLACVFPQFFRDSNSQGWQMLLTRQSKNKKVQIIFVVHTLHLVFYKRQEQTIVYDTAMSVNTSLSVFFFFY